MSKPDTKELSERSKNDHAIIVGSEVRHLCARVEVLEKALADALALYTERDSEEAYARYRAACAVLEGGGP